MKKEIIPEELKINAVAYALHKIITDEKGNIVNYKFIDINSAFEILSGYNKKILINKNFKEISINKNKINFNWNTFYDEILNNLETKIFQKYFEHNKSLYQVQVELSENKEYYTIILFDITSKKDNDDTISNKYIFESLLSTYPGIIYRCKFDKDWTMLYVSPNIFSISGYRDSDFINNNIRSYASIIHHEDSSYVFENIKNAVSENMPWSIEYRIIHKDENIIWVHERGQAVKNTFNNIEFLNGFITDISERKKTEESLKESETRFKNLSNSGQALIWTSGVDKKCDYFNQTWLNFTGKTLEEELGFGWVKGVHPDDLKRCMDIYSNAFDNREKFSMEYRLLHNDGKYRWIQDDGTPLYNSKNEFLGYIGHCLDITEKKENENTLRESEQLYSSLFHKNRAVKLLINHKNGKILDANIAASNFYGYSQNELKNMTIYQINTLKPHEINAEMFNALHQSKDHFNFSHRLKDGRIRNVEVYSTPIEIKGDVFLSSIIHDVTDKKLASEALIESEQKWRNILINTPQIGISLNTDAKIIFANQFFLKLTGYKKEEILGKDWFDIFIPIEIRENVKKVFIDVISKKFTLGFSNYENDILTKSGKKCTIAWSNVIAKDEKGNITEITCLGVDLTERKQAEEILKEREFLLSESQKIGHIGSFQLDLQNNKLIWSDEVYRIFGLNLNDIEMTYDKFIQFIHPEDRQIFKSEFSKSLDNIQDTYEIEHRIILKQNNEIRYLWVKCKHIRDTNCKVIKTIGMIQDITDRKLAEEAIKINQRYLGKIIETTSEGFFVIKKDGFFIDVNEAYCKLSGYTKDELFKMEINDVDAVETKTDTVERINHIIEKGSQLFETIHKRKDGSIWPVEVSANWMEELGGRFICFCRDLTMRKKREKELKNSEEKYRLLAENAEDVIFTLDLNLNYTYISPSVKNLRGFEPHELLGKNITQSLLPDSMVKVEKLIKDQLNIQNRPNHTLKSSVSIELQMHCKDGNYIWTEVNASFLRDEKGNPTGILGVSRNINERKIIEQALRESETRFKALHNASFGGIAIHDQGLILECNQGLSDMTGYSVEELIGMNGLLLISDKTRDLVIKNISSGYEKPYEAIGVRKNGEEYHLRLEARNIPYKGKNVRTVEFRDITESKLAKEAIEKRIIALTKPLEKNLDIDLDDLFNINDLQSIQDDFAAATGVASIITKVDGTPITKPSNFTYLCNDIIRKTVKGRLNCYKSDALIGKLSNLGPTIQKCISGGLWDAGAGISVGGKHIANWLIGQIRDESQTVEQMMRYADEIGADREKFLEAFLKVPSMSKEQFEKISKTLYTLASQLSNMAYQNVQQARFIEDRKNAEAEQEKLQQQLIQSQKMESVGRLAGGVAHDFNNMLTVILGYTNTILDNVTPNDKIYKYLNEILNAANRSADLTKQLLTFARKQVIEPKVLDLNLTIDVMKGMLCRLIGENISLIFNPCKNLSFLKMDPTQIDQILVNLCVNARDAIQSVGTITIETDMVTFDAEYCKEHAGLKPGDFILLRVTDTGCGMSKETLKNLFEPFFTTKDVGKSTGLGLAMVYGIIKQNNGFITVYSEINHGSIFNLYFPPHKGLIKNLQPKISDIIPKGKGETILIVEDELSILDMLCEIIKNLGYTVLKASKPSEALKIAENHKNFIHVLITDVIMPEMNGRELATKLNKFYPNLKILFMSGYTYNVIAHQGMLEEDLSFIQKPFSKKDIALKLFEILY